MGGKGVTILAVTWIETFVGLIFITLRFLSNLKFVGRFRWDFWVAAFTVLIECIAQIFLQLSVDAGMGLPMLSLEPAQLVAALHWSWVFQLLAIVASMLGKIAILIFLIQVRGRHNSKPWPLIVLGVLILAVNITVLGTILGQCKPMAKLWNDSLPGSCDPGRKINQNYSFFQASFNVFCDAALATYPIHLFWSLQMKLRIKIALSVLMGMGWIAAVCSAMKCYELKALTETKDITHAQPDLLIWASTEAWIVIIVGCVPPIRPLMERVLQTLGLTTRSKKRSDNYYGGYGSNRPQFGGSHSNYHSTVSGGTRKPRPDDLAWVELTGNRDSNDSNGSTGKIINHRDDILVTTEFETAETHRSHNVVSSVASQTSGDGQAGPASTITDIENVTPRSISH